MKKFVNEEGLSNPPSSIHNDQLRTVGIHASLQPFTFFSSSDNSLSSHIVVIANPHPFCNIGPRNPEKKDRFRGRISSFSFILRTCFRFSSLVSVSKIVCATIAWFTMSRENETSGLQMTSNSLLFDLATKGERVLNENLISTTRPVYEEGSLVTLIDTAGSSGTYRLADSLRLRYTPTVTDNLETRDVDESIPSDIGPGSSSELSLYIVPHTDTSFDVKVSLNIIAYATIEEFDSEGNPVTVGGESKTRLIEIIDVEDFKEKASAIYNTDAVAAAADYVKAADYLRGHILFFGGEGDTTAATESNRYYFTNPYPSKSFQTTIPANNQGKAVKIPLYWMWTNTLGQIALPNNISEERYEYPILSDSDTDKDEIKSYLRSNRAIIFANNDANTDGYIVAVTTPVVNKEDFNSAAFAELSRGYNQADYAIGTKISFFLIEVIVEGK